MIYMNKNNRKCPNCGKVAIYADSIFKCSSCDWEGWIDTKFKNQGDIDMARMNDRIVDYLKEHKSTDGKGIKTSTIMQNLSLSDCQLSNALHRIASKDNPNIIRVSHGRYEHVDNVSTERQPSTKEEPTPSNPHDVNATIGVGKNDDGCSVDFFAHTISHLTKEYGDRKINQSEFNQFISLLGNLENLFLNLGPKA